MEELFLNKVGNYNLKIIEILDIKLLIYNIFIFEENLNFFKNNY